MPMPFSFAYAVADSETRNDYEQKADSDGTIVTGSYRVVLPDTRIQIVTYTAGPDGYNAEVTYIGEAQYPEEPVVKVAPAPSYPAPAYPAPVVKEVPAASYPAPVVKEAPAPAYPAPVVKEAPAPTYAAPAYAAPVIKEAPAFVPTPVALYVAPAVKSAY
jgi:Insect cuticle protein